MSRFSKRTILLGLVALLVLSSTGLAADRGPVVTVGSETVAEPEMIRLIVEQSGANEMMAPFVLAQLSLEDRNSFADQMVMALLLSEAARTKGLHLDPSVASQLRWNAVNILAKSYVSSVSGKWDLDRPALEAWFAEHEKDYATPESAHVRHILVETEAEATNVLLEVYGRDADFGAVAMKYSKDPGSAQKGGDLGWVFRGQTVGEFDEMAFSLEPGNTGGPVETKFGWHIIQVLDRAPARAPVFDEAINQVREDLQQHYLAMEVERLGGSLGVEVDRDILSTLGGFPAYSATE
jgi:peptidyl-prolyl cis-trans isomerase C